MLRGYVGSVQERGNLIRRTAILRDMGLAPIEHDFTVDIGGEPYGLLELGTAQVDLSMGVPDFHRTWLMAGPWGELELPVRAVTALCIAALIPVVLILAALALRRRRRPA